MKNNLDSVISQLFGNVKQYKHRKITWYNISTSFDIETTSFYEGDKKRAIMYVWQFAFATDVVIIGRTWEEFQEFVAILSKTLQLSDKHRLVCYCHNLSYEMQFIRHYFTIFDILATKKYKPIKFCTSAGIEFRCSYLLTQQSLDALSRNYNLKYYKKPNYNYNLFRNSATPLTAEEIDYITSDVLAVNEYIAIELQEYGKISKIPNTATGKVRIATRINTIGLTHSGGTDNGGAFKYTDMIHELTLEPDEFIMAHNVYAGGLTHANAEHVNTTLYNVGSQDFTSSYPAVMVLECGFPMSKGVRLRDVDCDTFYHLLDYYALMFSITFFNIRPKVKHENIISLNKCLHITSKRVVNNGRIHSADALTICLTDYDFKAIQKFYEWDSFIINDLWYYKKGYLPKKLVMSVLKYYELKTTLKGVKSDDGLAELNYLRYKGYVNSLYGMCCLNPCKPSVEYNDEWDEKQEPIETLIEKYNNDKNRFLSYLWGVFISSIARYNLTVYGILPFAVKSGQSDYVYADTDSVKYLHPEKHKRQFTEYNKMIIDKIHRVAMKRNIPVEKFMPKTPKGEKAIIGVWSDEGTYEKFRTCGAKRYMTENNGEIHITVSGLNKRIACEYIKKQFDEPFEHFNEELYIPKGFTGKQTHTYCDYEIEGDTVDYLGNKAHYHELSFIHLEDADYDFNINAEYLRFIRGIKNEIK